MSKSNPPIWASIFIAGLVAGMFFAIGFKFGLSPDPIDISNYVLQQICTIEKTNEQVAYNCAIFIPFGILMSIAVGLLSIWVESNRIQSWKAGLGIYGTGWIIGLLYIIYNIK